MAKAKSRGRVQGSTPFKFTRTEKFRKTAFFKNFKNEKIKKIFNF